MAAAAQCVPIQLQQPGTAPRHHALNCERGQSVTQLTSYSDFLVDRYCCPALGTSCFSFCALCNGQERNFVAGVSSDFLIFDGLHIQLLPGIH